LIKKQKNGINNINDTRLIDLIKPSSLILLALVGRIIHRSYLYWPNYFSILS